MKDLVRGDYKKVPQPAPMYLFEGVDQLDNPSEGKPFQFWVTASFNSRPFTEAEKRGAEELAEEIKRIFGDELKKI